MSLTAEQKAIVGAFKPSVRPLLRSMRRSAQAPAPREEKFTFRGEECKAITTVEGDSGNGYQIIVALQPVGSEGVFVLDKADADALVAELDKAVEAAGWNVISNYPVSALNSLGRRIAPPAA